MSEFQLELKKMKKKKRKRRKKIVKLFNWILNASIGMNFPTSK